MAGIPWLPILTVGSQLLGTLFGNNENKSENVNSTTAGTVAGTTKQVASTDTTQTQNQTSNQTSAQTSAEQQQTAGSADVSRLDSQTLMQLTQQVRDLMAGSAGSDAAVQQQLSEVSAPGSAFDSDAYVQGVMAAATDTINSDLASNIGQIESRSGGSRRSNSASALLAGKLRNQAGAQLAGVNADARARAAELKRTASESKTGQITNLASQTDQKVAALLGSLLQASEKQTQTGTANTTGQTGGTTTGNTATTTVESTDSTQEQTQAQQTTQQTKSTGSSSTNELNFKDMFTKIGDILTASFNK